MRIESRENVSYSWEQTLQIVEQIRTMDTLGEARHEEGCNFQKAELGEQTCCTPTSSAHDSTVPHHWAHVDDSRNLCLWKARMVTGYLAVN
jgi:hypothetical protein